MAIWRKSKKTTLYFWVGFLSIALVCAQGVKLHVHNIDHANHHHAHQPLQQDGHIVNHDNIEHTHVSIAHLSTDISHSDQHEEVLDESDACPECLLSKINGKVPFLALLAVLFMLGLFGFYQLRIYHRYVDDIFNRCQCYFFPPLRAPPV